MKILNSEWITTLNHTIGVVCIENVTGERSVRIGVGISNNEHADEQYVADWGAKLTYPQAKAFFPDLIDETNFKKT